MEQFLKGAGLFCVDVLMADSRLAGEGKKARFSADVEMARGREHGWYRRHHPRHPMTLPCSSECFPILTWLRKGAQRLTPSSAVRLTLGVGSLLPRTQ